MALCGTSSSWSHSIIEPRFCPGVKSTNWTYYDLFSSSNTAARTTTNLLFVVSITRYPFVIVEYLTNTDVNALSSNFCRLDLSRCAKPLDLKTQKLLKFDGASKQTLIRVLFGQVEYGMGLVMYTSIWGALAQHCLSIHFHGSTDHARSISVWVGLRCLVYNSGIST